MTSISRFGEDILQSLTCHLDVRSAARAALVCSQWYRAATPVVYAHIFLHAGSWETSSALSRTLLRCPHLRRHVKHLTVIHCARYFPYMGNWLYGWLTLVPEGSLRSCRAIGGAALVGSLLVSPAVRAAPRLAVLTLFYKTSDTAVPHVEVVRCDPGHSTGLGDSERHLSGGEFLRRLLPHFRVKWGPDTRNTLYLSIASPASEGGVSLSELYKLLRCLSEHLARANFVVLTLGYTSCPMPTGSQLCEQGLAQVTRQPSRCQCASESTPDSFVNNVSPNAPAVCATLIGGEPFSVGTAQKMLECMDTGRRSPPVWAHVAILRVAGVHRGMVCKMCGVQLYAMFHPSFDSDART